MPHIFVRGAGKRMLSSMGLVKSGNQTVPQNTNTVLAPMIVDSDYPGTVMSGTSGVKANVAGEWQVTAQCSWNTSDNNRTFRLLKNGTSVTSTSSGSSSVSIQGLFVARVPVVEGDVLTMDVNNGTLNSTSRVVQGGVATFLRARSIPEDAPKDLGMTRPSSPTQAMDRAVWTKVTGWVADSGRPGSSVLNDGLVVSGNGGMTVTVSVSFTQTLTSNNLRVKRNNTVVAEFSGSGTSVGGTSMPFQVVSGDVLTVEFYSNETFGSTVSSGSLFTTVSM